MERDIVLKIKVASIYPQHLQYMNNPIIVSAKVEKQKSELTRFAFPFAYLLIFWIPVLFLLCD